MCTDVAKNSKCIHATVNVCNVTHSGVRLNPVSPLEVKVTHSYSVLLIIFSKHCFSTVNVFLVVYLYNLNLPVEFLLPTLICYCSLKR